MRLALALMAVVLCSCAPIRPTHASGKHLTTVHGTARFSDAMTGAAQYCSAQGSGVRHLGTDTPPGAQSVSRFECVAE